MSYRLTGVVLTLAVLLACSPARADRQVICTGDCNYDGATSIDELLKGVRISLGGASLASCADFDLSADGSLSIDELMAGVRNALRGCPTARFVQAACEVPPPTAQEPANMTCGSLIVPENRDRHNGQTISLAVVVLRALAASPEADPLVFLSGGPGGWALDGDLPTLTREFAAPIQGRRDIVIFDQRGTGRSRPALDCPERMPQRDAYGELLTPNQEAERDAAALLACRDRLIREGNDLSAYTSAATAQDIADLMTALGHERFNIYGLSYGTRVALTALRDLPKQRIRSVVLDSVAPPQANLFRVGDEVQRSYELLLASCQADAACNAAYPNLEQTTFQLIESLNAAPLALDPVDPDGQSFHVVVTGDRLVRLAESAFQSAALIPFIPIFTVSTANGISALLTAALTPLGAPELFSPGLQQTVLCNEEEPFISAQIVAQVRQRVDPHIASGFPDPSVSMRVCPQWGTPPPDPIENEPVHSDVPALILAGEYDTATPPAWGRLAGETLPHSYYFEFRGFGHVVLSQQAAPTDPPACAMQLLAQFLDDPTRPPDRSCVDAIPPPHFVGS